MKKKNTLRLLLGASLIAGAGAAMSSCADMWMSTTTGFDFTQPGGFGLDIGVGGPIGHHRLPPVGDLAEGLSVRLQALPSGGRFNHPELK